MHFSMGRLAAAVISLSMLGLAPALVTSADAARPDSAHRVYIGETGGNKSFNLKLTNLPNGKIKATWWTNVKTRSITKWVIKTSTSRKMDQFVKGYKVKSAGTRSAILDHASLVTPASGDYTFVKLYMYPKKKGKKGARPFESATWWIRPTTPVAVPGGTGRVKVGAFNVRTWNNESGPDVFKWSNRRANVTREILESGADVVGIQEASGSANKGYGELRQRDVIAGDLAPYGWQLVVPLDKNPRIGNAPDPGYYLHPGDTKPVRTVDGLQGTRILYNANEYTLLDNGYIDAGKPNKASTVWIPWARFQQISTGLTFSFISAHLTQAADPQKGPFPMAELRIKETQKIVELVNNLNAAHPSEQSIVVGDMNSTIYTFPFNGVHREFVRSGFYDAFATNDIVGGDRPTTNSFVFPVDKSPQRRDYILTKGGPPGSFRYVNRVYQNKSLTASDHFMQVAELPIG